MKTLLIVLLALTACGQNNAPQLDGKTYASQADADYMKALSAHPSSAPKASRPLCKQTYWSGKDMRTPYLKTVYCDTI